MSADTITWFVGAARAEDEGGWMDVLTTTAELP